MAHHFCTCEEGPHSVFPRRYPKDLAGWLEQWWPNGLQAERIYEGDAYRDELPNPPGLSGFSRMAGLHGGGPPHIGHHPVHKRRLIWYTYGFSHLSRN